MVAFSLYLQASPHGARPQQEISNLPCGNASPDTLSKDRLQRTGLIDSYLFSSFAWVVVVGAAHSVRARAPLQGAKRGQSAGPSEGHA